jgi:hypothetical protein
MEQKKPTYAQLEYHASDCQISADEMAIRLIEQQRIMSLISVVQSICDFNLAFIYHTSVVLVNLDTLEFMQENIKRFKRKITLREFFIYDFAIRAYEFKDWNDFVKHYKK